jgi:hypothetical protein
MENIKLMVQIIMLMVMIKKPILFLNIMVVFIMVVLDVIKIEIT